MSDETKADEPAGRRVLTGDGGAQATAGAVAAKPGRSRHPVLAWLKETLIVALLGLGLLSLLHLLVFQMFIIPSGSMEHTLDVEDRIVVPLPLHYHRGDVVVFGDPGGWLGIPAPQRSAGEAALEFLGIMPDNSENYLVKRVIGLPGDHVTCCTLDGKITVNGAALDEGSYLYSEGGRTVAPSDFPFDVVVPAGRIFVMGDHRNNSDDSRCHLQALGQGAFVPQEKVKGVAALRVYPFNRFKPFTTPATFAAVPAPGAAPAEAEIHADQVTCH